MQSPIEIRTLTQDLCCVIRIKETDDVKIKVLLQPQDVAFRPMEHLRKIESDRLTHALARSHLDDGRIRQHAAQLALAHLLAQPYDIHHEILIART